MAGDIIVAVFALLCLVIGLVLVLGTTLCAGIALWDIRHRRER